ncbi:MAG: rod shape-determining protein RodA [Acidobacteria bacterium]|nr:rod shape-determining protein RodA [Acidobacteriota bacterium]
MTKQVSLRDFDWLLVGIVLLISILGVVQIYSTTANTKFAGAHWKQIYWVLLGLGLLLAVSWVDYHDLLNHLPWLYLLMLGLLVGVLVAGPEIAGARRWFRVGGISIQVAEIAKLVVILLLARFLSSPFQQEVSFSDLVKIAVAVGVPATLIVLQPDLGTAITLVPIALTTLFVAGLKWRHLALMVLAGALVLPIGYHFLKPYQKARLAIFLDPEADPQRSGYQILQSKIAVGSGQLWGKGTAQGTQTQLRFLPVPHTDFIFAAYGEEHGFMGVLFALILYFILMMRLVENAQTASDEAGTYVIVGIMGLLVGQILVNVGMVVGYVPVTGIPLPLMSYGGSATVFTFAAMGLVNSIRLRRFVN